MIRVDNLTKNYGPVRALNNVSFEVQDGEILGFLGPNGAGKSTTLKIITTYLAPTSGSVWIDDKNILEDGPDIRNQIGYLPELNPLYVEMSVYDYLKFVGEVRKITGSAFNTRLGAVIDLCGLEGVVHKNILELSKGYRQRVGLAQAIFHDPKILILDEPSSGLDPNQIVEIRELIKTLGKKKTVIMSSHILQEMQATADRVLIINKGSIVANGTTDELMSGFRGQTMVVMELEKATESEVRQINTLHPEVRVKSVTPVNGGLVTHVEFPNHLDFRRDLFEFAKSRNWVILEMTRTKTSLEDVFRNLTKEENAA